MKISVIIPTYKPKSYLWDCLNSLCAQSFPHESYELIVILNGCNEPYRSKIKGYISKHPETRWKFVQTDIAGVSNARNIGLDLSASDNITFIDDDDHVSPSYLERLYEVITPNAISVAFPCAFYEDSGLIWREYPISLQYKKHVNERCASPCKVRRFFSGPCMKLIPMSIIQKRRFDKRFTIGEDMLFMFLISDRIKEVKFANPDAVYFRRYRRGSLLMSQGNYVKRLSNQLGLLSVMTCYYFPHFWRYSLKFTALQFASVLKGLFKFKVSKYLRS